MHKKVVALVILGLGGCAGNSQTTGNEMADERICTYERETGSSMRTRVCRTPAEIEAERIHAEQTIRDMDERSISAGGAD